ncbi:MAG: hypothetical protein HWE27_17350 [Gammaproteobacteria bacterium]|nr:hypothetical protein [Gammaproteobacteria bacterium]
MTHSENSSNEITANTSQPFYPVSFWLIGIIALLWNCAGLFMFIIQASLTPEAIAQLPSEQQSIYQNMPIWVLGCFGLATISGTLGSLFLLLKRRLAFYLFVISTFAVIGQNIYNWFLSEAIKVLGGQAIIMPVIIIAINLFLIWFCHYSTNQGRLK